MMKGDSVSADVGIGATQKKILVDITNIDQNHQQRLQPFNQQEAKQQSAAPADVSAEQLLKENAMLMKMLANRNAMIESCKAELQKCQSNFQKLRKQNSELVLTNGHLMVELNSTRQRLRELQLELGSKNGVLKAMKLELTAKENTEKLKHGIEANEVSVSQKQSDQTFQEDKRGEAKRKRVSKPQASEPVIIKKVKSKEKVDNQSANRYSSKRQSAQLKAEKPGPTEDDFEVDEIKFDVSHLQEQLENENEPTALGSKVHEEAREDPDASGPTNPEQVHAKKNIEKRHSLRRQSARFRPENPEPSEDYFEIDDAKFAISHLCDEISEKNGSTKSSVTSGEENNACIIDPQEIRRSSVGRPLRRTVEKVQSYKEIPLNVKMRKDN